MGNLCGKKHRDNDCIDVHKSDKKTAKTKLIFATATIRKSFKKSRKNESKQTCGNNFQIGDELESTEKLTETKIDSHENDQMLQSADNILEIDDKECFKFTTVAQIHTQINVEDNNFFQESDVTSQKECNIEQDELLTEKEDDYDVQGFVKSEPDFQHVESLTEEILVNEESTVQLEKIDEVEEIDEKYIKELEEENCEKIEVCVEKALENSDCVIDDNHESLTCDIILNEHSTSVENVEEKKESTHGNLIDASAFYDGGESVQISRGSVDESEYNNFSWWR